MLARLLFRLPLWRFRPGGENPIMNEETLFHEALQKPVAERAGFLAQACGGDVVLRRRVEILLEAHDNPDSHLDPNSPVFAPTIAQPAIVEAPEKVIGPYKLLEQIGE